MSQATDAGGRTAAGLSPARRYAALSVLVLSVLLIAIDGTVLSLALPAISADLSPSATQLLWIGDAYSFALAGLLLAMGSLGDRIGRKRLLLIGATGFGVASVVAAYAPSAGLLIAARVLLGVAGATLMPSTLALIRSIFPDARERTRAIAVWSAAAGAGAALGPLVGGWLLEHFWWGSVFLINLPVMVGVLALGAWLLPESRNPEPGPFDPVSVLLSVLTVIPVVYAVKEAASHGVGVATVALVAAGGLAGWGYVRRQRGLAAPMIDLRLFRIPAFSGAVLVNLTSIFALSGLLFFGSLYLQLVEEYSPLQAGIRQVPATLGMLLSATVVGVLLARLGRGRLLAAGLLLGATGMGLLTVAVTADGYLPFGLALLVIGAGVGLGLVLTTDAVVSAAPPRQAGAASAVSETAYELGIALGIAVLGSVLGTAYRAALNLPAGIDGAAAATAEDSIVGAVEVAASVGSPLGEALLAASRTAFVDGMQVATLVGAAVLVAAAVLAWRLVPNDRGGTPAPH